MCPRQRLTNDFDMVSRNWHRFPQEVHYTLRHFRPIFTGQFRPIIEVGGLLEGKNDFRVLYN